MEELKKIFYDPKYSYPNVNELSKIVKQKKLKISHQELTDFYNAQQLNQIFKPKITLNYEKMKSIYDQVGTLQADLLDVRKWKDYNKIDSFDKEGKTGCKYLLNVVDIFSRYAWSVPLTTKSSKKSKEIADKLEAIYKEIQKLYPDNPLVLQVDKGNEFLANVSKLNEDYNVEFIQNNPDRLNQHTFMSIIERFNRTILNKITKYMYANDTLNYIDHLQELVEAYNNKIHSTLKVSPASVFLEKTRPPIFVDKRELDDELDVGDKVRIVNKEVMFEKKTNTPKLSLEVYKVDEKRGNRYIIKNIKGDEPLKRTFLSRELYKIPSNTEQPEKQELPSEIKKNEQKEKTTRDIKKDLGNLVDIQDKGKVKIWTDVLKGETKEVDVNEPRQLRARKPVKYGKGKDVIYLKPANDKIHKYVAYYNGKKIYFGAYGMTDFILSGGDEDRKKRYIARHRKREQWDDLNKAGTYSRYILWNLPTFDKSIKDFEKRFDVKVILK
jgi:hypothetical protein